MKFDCKSFKQFFLNQLRLLKDSNVRRVIVFLILLLLIGLAGEYKSYFIEKNGVLVVATILEVRHAPRGRYAATVKYSYMLKPYQKVVSFNEDFIQMESSGKRLIVSFLPKHPTMCLFLDYAPDCLGDNPPEGWSEIPKCE